MDGPKYHNKNNNGYRALHASYMLTRDNNVAYRTSKVSRRDDKAHGKRHKNYRQLRYTLLRTRFNYMKTEESGSERWGPRSKVG